MSKSVRKMFAPQRPCSGAFAGVCAVVRLFAGCLLGLLEHGRLDGGRQSLGPARLQEMRICAFFRAWPRLFALCMAAFIITCAAPVSGATPVGTMIDNTAYASYNVTSVGAILKPSNKVSFAVTGAQTQSEIVFLQYAPTVLAAELIVISQTQ